MFIEAFLIAKKVNVSHMSIDKQMGNQNVVYAIEYCLEKERISDTRYMVDEP